MQDSGSLEAKEVKAYALLRAIKGAQELNISKVFLRMIVWHWLIIGKQINMVLLNTT